MEPALNEWLLVLFYPLIYLNAYNPSGTFTAFYLDFCSLHHFKSYHLMRLSTTIVYIYIFLHSLKEIQMQCSPIIYQELKTDFMFIIFNPCMILQIPSTPQINFPHNMYCWIVVTGNALPKKVFHSQIGLGDVTYKYTRRGCSLLVYF